MLNFKMLTTIEAVPAKPIPMSSECHVAVGLIFLRGMDCRICHSARYTEACLQRDRNIRTWVRSVAYNVAPHRRKQD